MKSSIRRPARSRSSPRAPFLQRKPSAQASRPFISNPVLQRSPSPTGTTPVPAQTAAIPATKTPAGITPTWPHLKTTAQTLYAKNDPAAAQAYQKAVCAALSGMQAPPGLVWRRPATADIQIDFSISSAEAQTRQREVEKHPGDYWKWIFFGAGALADTAYFTRAVTHHELVHVVQYMAYWARYQSAAKPGQSWLDFMAPYNERTFASGPEELEAHVTSLSFLGKEPFSKAETDLLYRGLLTSLIHTYTYTAQTRPAYRQNLDVFRDQALAAFDQTNQKESFSKALWWSLVNIYPDPKVTKLVVDELKRIAAVAYNLPEFKPFCQSFLREQGLMK